MRHDPAMDQATSQQDVRSPALAEPTHVLEDLITQVLPKAHDRAKDLGIINIAIVCPYAIGPATAAPLVSLAGYPALYAATAVVGIVGSIGVWKIKSVR
jgi:hypothetical protein